MSPARRLLLQVIASVVTGGLLAAGVVLGLRGRAPDLPPVAQDRPGPVLLVPGYGGDPVGLGVLAQRLQQAGRSAAVVPLPGDGTGDLERAADVLGDAAERAVAGGAPSVDVVGYSAGGVVARLWVRRGGAQHARRVVTLGSPHHGTQVAALGAVFAPGACPVACQQLVPGSRLLDQLNDGDETPDGPQWLSVWTDQDTVVTPPDSASLAGATQVVLQQVCPGRQVDHRALPRDPAVQGVVLAALGAGPVAVPSRCPV